MTETYFVTGTDTEVGKSFVSAAILHAASKSGKTTLGLKPIAAGCEETTHGLRNDDALLLSEHSTVKIAYEYVNPIALKDPMAPHIAAEREGNHLTVSRTVGFLRGVMSHKADLTLIEGAGGWRVPLNKTENFGQVAKEINVPVILVVGIRLGCINHALLTAEAIMHDGVHIAGWVANIVDPKMREVNDNIDTLTSLLPFPCLGEVPYIENARVDVASQYIQLNG